MSTQFSSIWPIFKQFSLASIHSTNLRTVLFQNAQFSISRQFRSVWSIDRTLSGATTLTQSGPGSNGNEGVLHIPQRSWITGASPSNCLVSYPYYFDIIDFYGNILCCNWKRFRFYLQISHLNFVLMLNWIVWKRAVFTFNCV